MRITEYVCVAILGVATGVAAQVAPLGSACKSVSMKPNPPTTSACGVKTIDGDGDWIHHITHDVMATTQEECAQSCWADGRCKSFTFREGVICYLWDTTFSGLGAQNSTSGINTSYDKSCTTCTTSPRACSKVAPTIRNTDTVDSYPYPRTIYPWVVTGDSALGWYATSRGFETLSQGGDTGTPASAVSQSFAQVVNACKGVKFTVKATITNTYENAHPPPTPFQMTVSLNGVATKFTLPRTYDTPAQFSHTFTAPINNPLLKFTFPGGQSVPVRWVMDTVSLKKA